MKWFVPLLRKAKKLCHGRLGRAYVMSMDRNNEIRQRRWFTNGASMAHTGWGRTALWVVNLLLYVLLNMFYLRIKTGLWLQLEGPYNTETLIPTLLSPLNIFQFPGYIIVTALLMGLLCTVPILTAQLYNFFYAIPFLFAVFFLGHNPILTLCLTVSCAAVSFEPLRFKSKFVSAISALLPVALYWVFFSGPNPQQDALRWAVLYASWAIALLICVTLFGVVLGLGHFLRYRPGVLMPIFGFLLAGTVWYFHSSIGMNERDFQAEVYRYSPGLVADFQDRSIKGLLEEELSLQQKQAPFLSAELLARQIRMEWRWAFNPNVNSVSGNSIELSGGNPMAMARAEASRFVLAKITSSVYIDEFINDHPGDPREADALYYKALIIDIKVDSRALRDEDTLRFYDNVPSIHSQAIWNNIIKRFGQTEVAIEARWRLARLLAAVNPQNSNPAKNFNDAIELLQEARQRCQQVIAKRKETTRQHSFFWNSRLGAIFTPPPPTVSNEELLSLKDRIERLALLISPENRASRQCNDIRLAKFIGRDACQLNYEDKLKELTLNSPKPDPLGDNIELAQAMTEKDPDDKKARLTDIIKRYPRRDAGLQAMLELARILLEDRKSSEYRADRQNLRQESL
ncbi:MAG: hypothetical protein KAT56_08970, partial [Sedimentisphaerales bacterium]|nr:hypothetical protein [Sedimentisphaerales bacterium]